MRLIKSITANEAVRSVLCWAGAQYIRLVHATGRWTVEGGEIPRRYWAEGRPFILCFWHGRLLMMPCCWDRRVPIHMLISSHRDGRIIARTVGHFGIRTVTGSTAKGGQAALRAILRLLKSGACVGFTPDGPRGPRMRASMGVISAARLSGAAIVPVTYSARGGRLLGSWDRFLVALPFARGVFVWGDPLEVPRDADPATMEALRRTLEDRLNALTRAADRRCRLPEVAPAEIETPAPAEGVAGGAEA